MQLTMRLLADGHSLRPGHVIRASSLPVRIDVFRLFLFLAVVVPSDVGLECFAHVRLTPSVASERVFRHDDEIIVSDEVLDDAVDSIVEARARRNPQEFVLMMGEKSIGGKSWLRVESIDNPIGIHYSNHHIDGKARFNLNGKSLH